MLNINPRLNSQNVNFKGNEDYTKTHAGLKTGIAAAAIPAALNIYGNVKAFDKRSAIVTLPLLLLSNLGCGAIVDYAINKKREKGENSSGTGKKVGALTGAVVFPAMIHINNKVIQNPFYVLPKTAAGKAKAFTIVGAIGALGGLILGGITDHFAKKSA